MATDLLNVRETADRLGVHENTIRNWQAKGLLRAIRLPGSNFRRFPREEVERMHREMFQTSPPLVDVPDITEGIRGTVVDGELI